MHHTSTALAYELELGVMAPDNLKYVLPGGSIWMRGLEITYQTPVESSVNRVNFRVFPTWHRGKMLKETHDSACPECEIARMVKFPMCIFPHGARSWFSSAISALYAWNICQTIMREVARTEDPIAVVNSIRMTKMLPTRVQRNQPTSLCCTVANELTCTWYSLHIAISRAVVLVHNKAPVLQISAFVALSAIDV